MTDPQEWSRLMSRAAGAVNRAKLLNKCGKLSEEKRQALREEVDKILAEAHVVQSGVSYIFDYDPL